MESKETKRERQEKLQKKADLLEGELNELLVNYPRVCGHTFVDNRDGMVALGLSHRCGDDRQAILTKLTISEVGLMGAIADLVAGAEFVPIFCSFQSGVLTYQLIPKS